MTGALTQFARRFRRDARGVSAVEFAFIAPVMIVFYFGLAEVTQAEIAQRRTITTASAMGDLIAQAPGNTTAANVDDIMNMGNVLMYPFPVSGIKVCINSIVADNNNVRTVTWRRQNNDSTCPAIGSTAATLSTNIISAGQSVVMARVIYPYTSSANEVLHSNPTFTKTYYLRPRRAATITCADCT